MDIAIKLEMPEIIDLLNDDDVNYVEKVRCLDCCTDNQKLSILLDAVEYEDLEETKEILQYKFNINKSKRNLMTPLHFAVLLDNFEITEELLKHNADVEVINDIKETPLIIATKMKNLKIVRKLLKYKANPNVFDTQMSPLHIAIENGCNEIAKELVKNGADLNAVDDASRTPLYISVQEGNIEIARLLLDEGCNVNAHIYDTALHIAVDDGNYLMVSELLERGANANLKCFEYFEEMSPFQLAVTKNDPKFVRIFFDLEINVDFNLKNKERKTALELAFQHGNIDIVKMITFQLRL